MSSDRYNERLQRARNGNAKKNSSVKNIEKDLEANFTDLNEDSKKEDVTTKQPYLKTKEEKIDVEIQNVTDDELITYRQVGRDAINIFERRLVSIGKKLGVQVVFD